MVGLIIDKFAILTIYYIMFQNSQQMLQDFLSVSDHFWTLCIKWFTIIRLVILRVVFSGVQVVPPFIFQEELT